MLLGGGALGRDRPVPRGPGWADPGDVITAEIASARLVREKGPWAAFSATATRDAQLYSPAPTRAVDLLRGRKTPAASLRWQPDAAWMSCDGSYAVTRGTWQDGDSAGWFFTVWQRQQAGDYRWVLRQTAPLPAPAAAPEFLVAKVAECPVHRVRRDDTPGKAASTASRPAAGGDYTSFHSDDGTLAWSSTGPLRPSFAVRLRTDGEVREVARAGGI